MQFNYQDSHIWVYLVLSLTLSSVCFIDLALGSSYLWLHGCLLLFHLPLSTKSQWLHPMFVLGGWILWKLLRKTIQRKTKLKLLSHKLDNSDFLIPNSENKSQNCDIITDIFFYSEFGVHILQFSKYDKGELQLFLISELQNYFKLP